MPGVETLLRRILFYGLGTIFLIAAAVTGYLFKLETWSQSTVEVPKAIDIHFPAGTKLDELAGALESTQLIDSALNFKLWVKVNGSYGTYQAGQYRFSGSISPQLIQDKIVAGKSFTPIVLQFVIPEGFTLKQVTNRLVANKVGEYKEIWNLMHDKKFIADLGLKAKTLEGYLYPATYSFTQRESPRNVLKKWCRPFGKICQTATKKLLRQKDYR